MNPEKFVCPNTLEPLRLDGNYLVSASGKKYAILPGNKPDFIGQQVVEEFAQQRDVIDRLKAMVKNIIGKHYILLTYVLSPIMPKMHWQSFQ